MYENNQQQQYGNGYQQQYGSGYQQQQQPYGYGNQQPYGYGNQQPEQRTVGIFEAYRLFFQNYTNTDDRSSRSEYWGFALANLIIVFSVSFILGLIGGVTRSPGIFSFIQIASLIYAVVTLVPNITLTVRRLHDTGRSGWWWFILLIPFIGYIWMIVLMCLPSDPYENEYGQVPNLEYNA